MTEINETRLPGVGIRHDFLCESGDRVGVITHHVGRRELVMYDPGEPDKVEGSVNLTTEESGLLADLLGGASITERFEDLGQEIAGLVIDWLPVSSKSKYVGLSIGETELRTRTGVSIVAILRGDTTIPAPGPDELLRADDTAVVVGTADGIQTVTAMVSKTST